MTRFQHTRDMYVGIAAMCIALFFLVSTVYQVSPRSDSYGISGRTQPSLVAVSLLALGLYLYVRNLILRRRLHRHDAATTATLPNRKKRFTRVAVYAMGMAVYIIGFSYVDYILSSLLMLIFGMWLSGFRHRPAFVCIAVLVPVLVYCIFSKVMDIPLPESIFGLY